MNIKLQNKIAIHTISDITEAKDYYVIRALRKIHFHKKNEQMDLIKTIDLGIDHECGYQKIESKDNLCFLITHSTPREDDNITGDPKIAHLNAYTIEGLVWTYKLSAWSICQNFGGLFIIENTIVFNDKIKETIYTYRLDLNSGEIISKTKSPIDFYNTCNTNLGNQMSLSYKNNLIFSDFDESVVKFTIDNNQIHFKTLCETDPLMMCQNEDFIAINTWTDKCRIIIIEKKTNEIKYNIALEDEIDIDTMLLSNHGNKLFYSFEDNNKLTCIDYVNSNQLWSRKTTGSIYQFLINKDDTIFLYINDNNPYIEILDSHNGKQLYKMQSTEEKIQFPFFIVNNNLLVQKWNNSLLYKLHKKNSND